MSAPWPLPQLEAQLGWQFRNRALLAEALTHSTYANEHPESGPNNERLEFLGDAVLGLLAAQLLYAEPTTQGEGEMSRRRARVVRREALARQGQDLGLDAHLRLGEGQKLSGAGKRILADAYEAVAGAVFIDGGFAAVEGCFGPRLAAALAATAAPDDHKTQLQELCHRLARPQPKYLVREIRGPDHAREYAVEVHIGTLIFAGTGPSKKAAEGEGARVALASLHAVPAEGAS